MKSASWKKNMQDYLNIMYLAWQGQILKVVFTITNTLFASRFDEKSFMLFFFLNMGFFYFVL